MRFQFNEVKPYIQYPPTVVYGLNHGGFSPTGAEIVGKPEIKPLQKKDQNVQDNDDQKQ